MLVDQQDGVVTLTMNRPQAMNSVTFEMLDVFRRTVDELAFRTDVRVVIITGAGNKAFSAGADLKERATLNPDQVKQWVLTIRNLFTAVEALPQPVIAAINGFAFGGGTELALASDIRIAAETATLGLTETRLGVIPAAGGTQRLPRLIGAGKAKELIYCARRIGAVEALEIGLVNKVCPLEKLMEESREMAAEICKAPPVAITQAKHAINNGLQTDLNTGLSMESNAYWVCLPTKDRLEALAAFAEKRPPVFTGK